MNFSIQLPYGVENEVNAAFSGLHYYFATRRPIIFGYGESKEILISDNPNANYLFDGGPNNATVTKITNTGMFFARIYETIQELDPLRQNDPFVKGPEGTVKITTDITGKMVLDQAGLNSAGLNRVVYNNIPYRIASVPANYGLLQRPFYSYNLIPAK